ncbi:MAG: zinc-dependent alcohol dehydrogenase family protein [Ferrovibrio sp.]|uniref:zinc-dependent alcohol dehydrogenase family protein n=1 Tax=Ferrovibrio sp. TaxID=1917215 RepID=UPI002617B6E1|nr:zinc-dependent alcohol dehydrogenase family protein [Ferrovibrio sp.]MCW0232437.1 zinc-dependent alcohol dehydrogenase family protein [Ferrovibrio sp.]
MRAMLLHAVGRPLIMTEIPAPVPGRGQLQVQVAACGVCRTDLHVVDGELPDAKFPLVPGHEIVGRVSALGDGVADFAIGERVGIPWLGWSCGECRFCRAGEENLCDEARFTGYQIDGGYADRAIVDQRYCFRIPDGISDIEAAPLLCAGLIGYRAYRMAGAAGTLGLYGFGAAAHILIQVAVAQGVRVYAFTRPDDKAAQDFARQLGAIWAGASDMAPPELLDAAIIFAPLGNLVPVALQAVRKGGRVICAGIHMSDIPAFPYHLLWGERMVKSVANLTRQDAADFLALAPLIPIRIHPVPYPVQAANRALDDLRAGRLQGAAVLTMDKS